MIAPTPFDLGQGANVNLLMQPLQQGMDKYRQGMDKQFEGERALAKEKLAYKADARADEDQKFQREQRLVQRMAAMGQVIIDDPNPTTAAANWQKWHANQPELRQHLSAYGINPDDYKAGASFILAEAGKYKSPIERQMQTAQLQHVQGQNAVNSAQLQQIKTQSPEYRASVAESQYGLQKGTPAYYSFIANGQYSPDTAKFQVIPDGASVMSENPRTGQAQIIHQGAPKVDSTTRKHIFDAQDELPTLRATVDQLNEAKQLLPNIYTGIGSDVRTTLNQALPSAIPNIISDPSRAKATQRYNQIMNAEGIGAMSQTLKGATTDFEMRKFMSIMNDSSQSPETKVKALDYMIRKAQAHYQNKVERIRELGGRMPNDGGTQQAPPAGAAPDPLGIR